MVTLTAPSFLPPPRSPLSQTNDDSLCHAAADVTRYCGNRGSVVTLSRRVQNARARVLVCESFSFLFLQFLCITVSTKTIIYFAVAD